MNMKPENIHPELKKKLMNAKSMEEISEIADEAGCDLSDEELSAVSSGGQGHICPRDNSCKIQTIEPDPPIDS